MAAHASAKDESTAYDKKSTGTCKETWLNLAKSAPMLYTIWKGEGSARFCRLTIRLPHLHATRYRASLLLLPLLKAHHSLMAHIFVTATTA